MKTIRIAAIAALVGAITMAPTELLPTFAGLSASSASGALSITTNQFRAVAGVNSAATTAAAYALPTFTAGCTRARNTSGSTASGATTIGIATSTTGYQVGMVITAPVAGIQVGTKILTIKATNPRNITISLPTTAIIAGGTAITGNGCWQQYFNVNNIQTLNLVSFGISQVVSSSGVDTITLQRCAGTWTEATGVCSGAITTIVTTTMGGTSAVTTVPVALVATTGTVRLRALATINGIISTISISVRAGTDTRAATTTNS